MNLKVNKRWFILFTSHYISVVFVTCMFHARIFSSLVAGGLQLLSLAITGIYTLVKNKLFTPLLPPFILEFSFGIYTLQLVCSYDRFPLFPSILIWSCMYLWFLITIFQKEFESSKNIWKGVVIKPVNALNFKCIIYPLFMIAVLMMLFEWKMAGGIPALRSDSETFRFTVSYSAITHLLAIMNKILSMLIGVYLVSKDKIYLKKDAILIMTMFISETLMIGTSMRGEMVLAPCIIFIAYALKHKLSPKVYICAGIIALVVLGLIPLIRMVSLYGTSHIIGLKNISTYPKLYWLTPLYQSFANNFSILNLDMTIFPAIEPFGFGTYGILPEIPFFDLGISLADVQNRILNNNFYAGLTGTFFYKAYADFGYWGFILITVFYAVLCNWTFNLLAKRKSLHSLVLYSYTLYTVMWAFYAPTVDFVYLCYCGVIWVALKTRVGS